MTARRKGFALIEILIVMLILGITSGALCLRAAAGGNETSGVREEAEALAQWITNKMTRARLEGAGFTIVALRSEDGRNIKSLRLTRNDFGSGEKPEYYNARGAVLEIESATYQYTYNSVWHTLTPAVTINLKSGRNPSKVLYAVVVSGQGFVSVRPRSGAYRQAGYDG